MILRNSIPTTIAATISVIIVTPLCGYSFDCGCTWPWAGLTEHCNIMDPTAIHVCPWCDNLVLGTTIILLNLIIIAVITKLRFASTWFNQLVHRKPRTPSHTIPTWTYDSLLGVCVFTLLTIIAAMLTKYWFNLAVPN